MVNLEVAGVSLRCETKPDLFSPKGLDGGTYLLLTTLSRHPEYISEPALSLTGGPRKEKYKSVDGQIPHQVRDDTQVLHPGPVRLTKQDPGSPSSSTILDWGCGWGAIGLTLAKHSPDAQVVAIDSDIAAVATTKENASINRIDNIEVISSYSFDKVKDKMFDLITSNPPTHRGREVVDTMIAQSFVQLNSGGTLAIVIEARLKPWVARKMKETFGDYKIAKRGPKHVVLIAIK